MNNTPASSRTAVRHGIGAWVLRRLSGGGEWLRAEGRSPVQLLLANIRWLTGLALAFGAGLALRVPPPRALLLAVALGCLFLVVHKPWWFWKHPDLVALRRRIGDRTVRLLYIGLAVGLLALAYWL